MVDAAYHREYYQRTKGRRLELKRESQRKRRIKLRDQVREYKGTARCIDCGEADPIVLTFDHTEDNKDHNIADMISGNFGWDKIKAEIDKCEIVCANCHLRRSEKRRQEK